MNAPDHNSIVAALAADWLTYRNIEDEARTKRAEVETLIAAELRDGP